MTPTGSPPTSAPSSDAVDGTGWDHGTVVVVGAGIAGLACAAALRTGGADVVVLDRGRQPGGRLGLRRTGGGAEATDGRRVVDTGAAYAVPRDPAFAALAASWEDRGLAHPWTDTLDALERGADGRVTRTSKTGPVRWAAPGGLRSLTDDLATALADDGVPVRRHDVRTVDRVGPAGDGGGPGRLVVDGLPCRAVVLAMPDPQAVRLCGPGVAAEVAPLRARSWSPVVTVWARWDEAWWPPMDAAFVNGSDTVELVADDGRRRGDGAAVLVAHSTADLARAHLGEPEGAVAPVLAELGALLGDPAAGAPPAPVEQGAQRWTFARPDEGREETSWLSGGLGVCGDAWGPRPGVEQAWLSGTALGARLAAAVAAGTDRS